jgi:hypothetical protein
VRECATIFGATRCFASTIHGLSVRGLPNERSSKVKVWFGVTQNVDNDHVAAALCPVLSMERIYQHCYVFSIPSTSAR